MEDNIALEVIQEWGRMDSDAGTTMSTYQSIADHFFHRENQITKKTNPQEDKSLPVIDGTGAQDLADMAAGMSAVVFPQGQYFFRMAAEDEQAEKNEMYRSYLNYATQIVHRELFKPSCNFLLEINEMFMSWIGFGTGNIYSGWDGKSRRLVFKDWDVANFRFSVDYAGNPSRCIVKWLYTAQQAYDKWGENAGKEVVKAAKDPKRCFEKFPFLYRCRPRKNANNQGSNKQWAWEEVVINEKDKTKVFETGYKSFPYHIVRWLVNSQETWGYGQGNFALSTDKELQVQKKALLYCADMANKPPMQTIIGFEGQPKVYPGANNLVMEANQIMPLHQNLNGNFPITKDMVEMTKEDLHRYFYVKVFKPLEGLPGDRRTTVEIVERVKAGYMLLILPVMRLYNECLTPLIERCVNVLMENGVLPPPPAGLVSYKLDYIGRLALALREQQADALQRYSQFSVAMEQVVPGMTKRILNVSRAGRRIATTYGVNENDFNTPEEEAAIVQQEQQLQQAQMQMQAAQAAGGAYKDASGKAEEGSPAAAMMEQMGAGV